MMPIVRSVLPLLSALVVIASPVASESRESVPLLASKDCVESTWLGPFFLLLVLRNREVSKESRLNPCIIRYRVTEPWIKDTYLVGYFLFWEHYRST